MKGLPFLVSTCIHYYENYITGLNKKKQRLRTGLTPGF